MYMISIAYVNFHAKHVAQWYYSAADIPADVTNLSDTFLSYREATSYLTVIQPLLANSSDWPPTTSIWSIAGHLKVRHGVVLA